MNVHDLLFIVFILHIPWLQIERHLLTTVLLVLRQALSLIWPVPQAVAMRVEHAGNGHCPVDDGGESFEYKLGGPRPSWTRPGGNILFTFYTATKSVLRVQQFYKCVRTLWQNLGQTRR